MQLPFAVIPLIHFTSDRARMGSFANKLWVRVLAWLTAAVIIALNVRLAGMAIADWLAAAGSGKPWCGSPSPSRPASCCCCYGLRWSR
jgi:manganese transport protein